MASEEERCDLVTEALPRLVERHRLMAWQHDGFCKPADAVKERSELDSMARKHQRPWAVWDEAGPRQTAVAFSPVS